MSKSSRRGFLKGLFGTAAVATAVTAPAAAQKVVEKVSAPAEPRTLEEAKDRLRSGEEAREKRRNPAWMTPQQEAARELGEKLEEMREEAVFKNIAPDLWSRELAAYDRLRGQDWYTLMDYGFTAAEAQMVSQAHSARAVRKMFKDWKPRGKKLTW